MIFTITTQELGIINGSASPDYPKYTSQLINWANQNAQGTRPKIVGQLSDLFPEYQSTSESPTIAEWTKWYLAHYPDAIETATNKIVEQFENLKQAMQLIDRDLIKSWVEDLVINKTFNGLYIQKAILKKLATIKQSTYRLATPEEESKGIDGFVDNTPYSIKPDTYKTMHRLSEVIDVRILYYSKTKSGLRIEIPE